MQFQYVTEEKDSGKTVKSILRSEFRFSKNLVKRLHYHGQVLCNRAPVYMNHAVQCGDVVEASIDFEEESKNVRPVKMDLNILYEDESVIALDKPPGKIIHPIKGNMENTMANGLLYYYQKRGLHRKIRPVGRLDQGTTGVILFAKNQFVQDQLIRQMKTNDYRKEYIGIVHGCLKEKSGTIDFPIARTPGSILLRETSPDGAPSVTHYRVLKAFRDASVLHFDLETGRTHQIRVHCRAIGHPLIGDTLYSDIPTTRIDRQALHSQSLRFLHPITGRETKIVSSLPKDMLALLESLNTEPMGEG